MTMALPAIEHRIIDQTHIKLDLKKLHDEFDPQPSARIRTRSSSRESARRKTFFNNGFGSNPTLNREKSSYSLTSRPFSRSRSRNDLRAMVTSRNVLNSVKSAEKVNGDVTARPPLPNSNLLSARVHSKPTSTSSNNSLLANPRSSSGTNSYRGTPVMERKLSKGLSTPDIRNKSLSSSPIDTNDSPASTPAIHRRIVEYIDQSPEGSRPSSGQNSSANSGRILDGKNCRDVRIISNSTTQRITESNISRKEKVIHIVDGVETQKNNASNEDVKLTQRNNIQLPPAGNALVTSANTQNTPSKSPTKECAANTDGRTNGSEKETSAQKLFINRDNIEPPPTPRVGVGEDGEGLSKEVFMKCVDWLEGVYHANDHKTLDIVTLPPIEWND